MSKNYFRSSSEWPYHVSAGGLVYRVKNSEINVAVLHRLNTDNPDASYSLPKGTLKTNESIEAGALREVKEETGFDTKIEGYLGALHQLFEHPMSGVETDRTTHYFLLRYDIGDIDDQKLDETEAYDVEWRSISSAKTVLKNNPKQEQVIVDRALELLNRATK